MGFAAFLCPNHSRVLEDFRYGMNYDLNRHNNGKGGTVYEQHKILSGRKRLKGIPVLSAGTEQPVDKEKLLKYKEWLIANYAVSSVNSMLVRTARQYGKEQISRGSASERYSRTIFVICLHVHSIVRQRI